ncbi:hypothetical protein BT96DRAFT_991397 [Gymnopus androsaceus JB14]|uniref:Uncharacterized protein n=1 Tax=Gymnopus androsaceus JB14 TaxID=1447944 RepID=A0A6A4HZ59_9AGAR|nr:hypothetical protein BT96DRAFT_991397 [Gymnopus androsaceus JB14]
MTMGPAEEGSLRPEGRGFYSSRGRGGIDSTSVSDLHGSVTFPRTRIDLQLTRMVFADKRTASNADELSEMDTTRATHHFAQYLDIPKAEASVLKTNERQKKLLWYWFLYPEELEDEEMNGVDVDSEEHEQEGDSDEEMKDPSAHSNVLFPPSRNPNPQIHTGPIPLQQCIQVADLLHLPNVKLSRFFLHTFSSTSSYGSGSTFNYVSSHNT